jgi:hypothetical protein
MTEPETKGRAKAGFFSLKTLRNFLFSVVATAIATSLVDVAWHPEERAKLASFQASAYTAIAQFAPWNIAKRYVQIVSTRGNDAAEDLAEQQQRQANLFRSFGCSVHFASESGGNPCTPLERPHGIRAFYLSAHVPLVFRPITAFFDLLLHALIDQGFIGFLVATIQIAIGVLLTRIVIHRKILKLDAFYSYVLVVPLAVLVLGSFAAVPLWLVAFVGVTIFKGLPGAGLGAQTGGAGYLVKWLLGKAAEEFGHDAIVKQFKRIVGD